MFGGSSYGGPQAQPDALRGQAPMTHVIPRPLLHSHSAETTTSVFNHFDRSDVVREQQRHKLDRSRTPGPELMRAYDREDEYLRSSHTKQRSKTPTHELQQYHHNISGTPDFIPASQYRAAAAVASKSQAPTPASQPLGAAPYRGAATTKNAPTWQHSDRDRPLSNPDIMHMYKNDPYIGGRLNSSQSYSAALNKSVTHPANYGLDYNRPMSPAGDPGRARKQSTSFEHEEPMTSSVLRGLREPWDAVNRSRSPTQHRDEEYTVHLKRQDSGFGFRIIGGIEEGSQVSGEMPDCGSCLLSSLCHHQQLARCSLGFLLFCCTKRSGLSFFSNGAFVLFTCVLCTQLLLLLLLLILFFTNIQSGLLLGYYFNYICF